MSLVKLLVASSVSAGTQAPMSLLYSMSPGLTWLLQLQLPHCFKEVEKREKEKRYLHSYFNKKPL